MIRVGSRQASERCEWAGKNAWNAKRVWQQVGVRVGVRFEVRGCGLTLNPKNSSAMCAAEGHDSRTGSGRCSPLAASLSAVHCPLPAGHFRSLPVECGVQSDERHCERPPFECQCELRCFTLSCVELRWVELRCVELGWVKLRYVALRCGGLRSLQCVRVHKAHGSRLTAHRSPLTPSPRNPLPATHSPLPAPTSTPTPRHTAVAARVLPTPPLHPSYSKFERCSRRAFIKPFL